MLYKKKTKSEEGKTSIKSSAKCVIALISLTSVIISWCPVVQRRKYHILRCSKCSGCASGQTVTPGHTLNTFYIQHDQVLRGLQDLLFFMHTCTSRIKYKKHRVCARNLIEPASGKFRRNLTDYVVYRMNKKNFY